MTEGRIFLTATATTATDLKFACLFHCVFPKNVVSLQLETGVDWGYLVDARLHSG